MAKITITGQSDDWNTVFGNLFGFEVGRENIPPTYDFSGALRFTSVNVPQGATITEAILGIYVFDKGSGTADTEAKIWGMDEDNTGSFSSDPMGRTKTTAYDEAHWSLPPLGGRSNHNITSIVQEIVNRGGWSSGNAMGFIIENNGSPTDSWVWDDASLCRLEITYASESASPSATPSASPSRSASASPSRSPSQTPSASPSPIEPFFGLKIAKPGIDVLTTQEPFNLIFSSDYGTLKYFDKKTAQITFDANTGDIAGTATLTHNLGYYPYVEVYVSAYIGSPTGIYEYCPFFGSGATVQYSANYKITTTGITLYAEINGVSTSVWVFDFIVFIFKNNLLL
jgi:hypothetical protein